MNNEYWHSPTIHVLVYTNKVVEVTRYYPLNGNRRAYSGSICVHYDGTDADLKRAITQGSRYINDNKNYLTVCHGMDKPLGRIATKKAISTAPIPHLITEGLNPC